MRQHELHFRFLLTEKLNFSLRCSQFISCLTDIFTVLSLFDSYNTESAVSEFFCSSKMSNAKKVKYLVLFRPKIMGALIENVISEQLLLTNHLHNFLY